MYARNVFFCFSSTLIEGKAADWYEWWSKNDCFNGIFFGAQQKFSSSPLHSHFIEWIGYIDVINDFSVCSHEKIIIDSSSFRHTWTWLKNDKKKCSNDDFFQISNAFEKTFFYSKSLSSPKSLTSQNFFDFNWRNKTIFPLSSYGSWHFVYLSSDLCVLNYCSFCDFASINKKKLQSCREWFFLQPLTFIQLVCCK